MSTTAPIQPAASTTSEATLNVGSDRIAIEPLAPVSSRNTPPPASPAVVGLLDSSSSTGLDLAGLFNAFLASLNGQVGSASPADATPLNRLAAELSESLRKGLDERARAPDSRRGLDRRVVLSQQQVDERFLLRVAHERVAGRERGVAGNFQHIHVELRLQPGPTGSGDRPALGGRGRGVRRGAVGRGPVGAKHAGVV